MSTLSEGEIRDTCLGLGLAKKLKVEFSSMF